MTSPALERVYFGKYPYNLISSGNLQTYYQLLCNFDFLLGKIQHPRFGVQALIKDYDLLNDCDVEKHPDYNPEIVKALQLIQGALQLSEQVLIVDPTQLASQLWGRLQSFDIPEIQRLLQQTQQTKQNPTIWLRPLKSSLIPAGGSLLRILTGHNDSVNAIAITQDGKQVVSGSEDGVLMVWDLETGKKPLTLKAHSKLVTAIAISPDNKQVISGSEDGTLRVWDLTTGKKLFALAESGYIAMGLAITSDSNWAISVGRYATKEFWNTSIWHNCITLWNLKRKEHIFSEEIRLEGIELADVVALSSDGTKAIFCLSSRSNRYKYFSFMIKDLSDWHKILNVPNLEAKLNPNNYIAWVQAKLLEQLNQKNIIRISSASTRIENIMTVTVSSDGKQAITGLTNNTLIVWDLETKEQKFRLISHSGAITAVAITSDGTQAVSSSKDKTIKIWDLKTGEEVSTFTDFNNLVNSIAITPNGKQIISGSKDGTINFWKLNHNHDNNSQICQENLYIYKIHETQLNNYQLNRTASFIDLILIFAVVFIYIIGCIFIMFLFAKQIHFLAGFILLIFSLFLLILNIGSILVLPMWFRYIFLLDSQADMINTHQYYENNSHSVKPLSYKIKEWKNLLNKHTEYITTITVSLDGKKVISGSKNKTIILWDLTTLKQLYILTGHWNQVSSIAAIPNSKSIISSSFDGNLKIWDIENYNKVINLQSWSKTVYNIFYLILKICLYIPYLMKSLLLWISFLKGNISYVELCGSLFEVELLAIIAVLFFYFIDGKSYNQINKVIITSDGKKAISASSNKTLKVWNLIEKKQVFVLRGHRDWVTSIALISDDYLISGSKDTTLKVWNLKTREELFTLTGHSSPVTAVAVAVTPDGLQAISSSSDGSLKVWDLKSRKAILTIKGHRGSVEAIAVTPDGRHLVSAASDHTLRVWVLLTGEEITRFTADTPLTCCAIAPEGTTIVAGDRVGQLHFLRLEGIGASP